MAFSVMRALDATFSDVATRWARMFLSFSDVSFLALALPWTDHSRCVRARSCRSERCER